MMRRDAASRLRWGLAGVLVAWTLLRLLGLDLGWPVVPLLAFTPWVAALALVGAVAAALFGRKLFALAGGRLRALLIVALAPRVVPNRAPADAKGVRLRVLAANVAGDGARGAGGRRARAAAAGRRAGRRGADAARSRTPMTRPGSRSCCPTGR